MNQPQTQPPKLDAPGAGLPAAELTFASISFLLYRKLRDRGYASRHFAGEANSMLETVGKLNEQQGRNPVLINRVFGIEDSSRFWSPYMVLHHLVIVDSGIIKVIEALAAGNTDLREVKIADVKPSPATGPEVAQTFRTVIQDYEARLTKISDLNTTTKHPHPWFGPLNAHGWHCLAALHHGIHKRQLAAILAAAG